MQHQFRVETPLGFVCNWGSTISKGLSTVFFPVFPFKEQVWNHVFGQTNQNPSNIQSAAAFGYSHLATSLVESSGSFGARRLREALAACVQHRSWWIGIKNDAP